ncbi:hypothetical protein [Streptomyces lydicus]|uniref:hypothetical protein n=1 Tax=Streptomyces lydicus TaxID=47763 RepID=UPI0037A08EB0
MRRPALHHPRTGRTGWSHPYAPNPAICYADGGDEPPADAPTPADIAARAQQPAPEIKPVRPGESEDELIVRRDWLDQKFAAEKDSGRRNGNQRLASDLGFDDVNSLRKYVTDAREAEKAQLSATERREQELAERERVLVEREAQAAAAVHAANRRSVLVSLGATGDDLDDATALLRVANDATDDEVRTAAEALKDRRPELFGIKPTAATTSLPPAPGGAPAGGPPSRPAATSKPGDRGREMARIRGHLKDTA